MFAADQVITALLCFCIPKLASFALPDRIPADDEIAAQDQPLTESLVVIFSVWRVPGRDEDGWMQRAAVFGHIDERGHIITGDALVDEFLNMKADG